MTPQQWIVSQLIPILTAANPGADPDGIAAYANQMSEFIVNLVIPNLQDVNGNPITFVVPQGS